jgi:Flp pilus assembly protein TadG
MENEFDRNRPVTPKEHDALDDGLVDAARPARWQSRIRQRFLVAEGGSSMVEFALILPMLLLLVTGMAFFGAAMNNYMQLTNAVSVGARTLVANAGVTTNPCSLGATAIENAAPALTASKMKFSFTFNGTAYPNESTCSSSSTTTPGSAAGNLSAGGTLTVNATYPLNLSVYGKIFNLPSAVLSATATEYVQ